MNFRSPSFIPMMAFVLCALSLSLPNMSYAELYRGQTNSKPQQTPPLEKVSLQLKWLHQFQFAGYYAALKNGYYRNEGLDVTIKERDLFANNIEQVIEGESEYGVGDSMLLVYQAKKAPLVIVAPIFQHSPQVFITLKSSGINSLYDLNNQHIAFYLKDTDGFPLLAMMKHNDVTPNLDRMVIKTNPDMLLNGDVQAYPAYLSNEPYFFKQQGIEFNIINPINYGIDLYGDMLFTTQKEAQNHPERVERFKRATLKGWQYALSHKKELIEYIQTELHSQQSFDHLMYEANVVEDAIQPGSIPLGTLDEGRLTFMQKLLEQYGLIHSGLDLSHGIFTPETHKMLLDEAEMRWIKQHPKVLVAVDTSWAPIEFVDTKGHFTGITDGYLKYLSSLTGIEFVPQPDLSWAEAVHRVKFRELDMFSAVIQTEERENYVNFTQPYLKFPMVIATLKGENYIENFTKLQHKTIAVVKNYAAHELLKKHYPQIDFLLVDTPAEGLNSVAQGKAFGYVDNIAVIGYHIKQLALSSLQISGETPFKADVSMAIRKDWPELQSIIQKALNAIDTETQNRLTNPWLQVNYKTEIEWQTIAMILTPIGIIFLIVLFYNRKLRALNNQLSFTNQHLQMTQWELEASNNQLTTLSITDFLTEINNRKQLDKTLAEEVGRANRYQQSLSLIMIDLDNFKQINDTYGHLMGDEVLKTVSRWIQTEIRQTDTFGRWGGEEFMLICPSTPLPRAKILAEKLRFGITHLKFSEPFIQTVSIGVTCYQSSETTDQWISRTDNCLYMAKHQGKNQVIAD